MSLGEYLTAVEGLPTLSRITGAGVPCEDWQRHLRKLLKEPGEGQLPLNQQVFPGDRVAIAVSSSVPQGLEIARVIVSVLSESGIDMRAVTVVTSGTHDSVVEPVDQETWSHHDPQQSEHSALVGVSRRGKGIYLNQEIANADVVIPVVPAGLGNSTDGYLYPQFSIEETCLRLARDDEHSAEEALEAEQMVSPFFVVGIVSAPGDRIGEVLVAPRTESDRVGEDKLPGYWTANARPFGGVVATLGSVSRHYHVRQLYEAVMAAAQMVSTGGPIVILGNIELQQERDAMAESQEDADQEIDMESMLEAAQNESRAKPDEEEDNEWDEDAADYQDAVELGDSIRDEDGEDALEASGWGGWDEEAEVDDDSEAEAVDNDDLESADSTGDGWGAWNESISLTSLATLLDELRSRHPVFLVSQLSAEQVETLGFGSLDNAEELQRMLGHCSDVGLLEDAPRWRIV